VTTVARKATKVVGLLARVSRVYKGLPPKAASVAAKSTVGYAIGYAIEAWWPGLEKERLGRRSRIGLAKVANRVLAAAARTAVPAWRTTPTAEVLATCRLPPVEVVAGQRRARYRARARGDPGHVAHSRAVSAA